MRLDIVANRRHTNLPAHRIHCGSVTLPLLEFSLHTCVYNTAARMAVHDRTGEKNFERGSRA